METLLYFQSRAVDLHCLGVILYTLLVGRHPFFVPKLADGQDAHKQWDAYNKRLDKGIARESVEPEDRETGKPDIGYAGFKQPKGGAKDAFFYWYHSPASLDFVSGLLSPEPEQRMTVYRAHKEDAFFTGVDWEKVKEGKVHCTCVHLNLITKATALLF